ncbi:hypothetical protein COLO4_25773 [Corchorus olitorius]|uniref:Uncharacterized protein n=1 Tax=Corchorus olitorius TaxID=93759 RepID=A0A1R3I047_9ROSI|nr:hypothetical protein COLO4_25773 [Corchorus olitorius]
MASDHVSEGINCSDDKLNPLCKQQLEDDNINGGDSFSGRIFDSLSAPFRWIFGRA